MATAVSARKRAKKLEIVKKAEVTAAIEKITPEIAQQYLAKLAPSQRNQSRTHVGKIKTDVADGTFLLNGETIKFDWDGWLIDGQHRLQAIIDANIEVESLVVRGLDPAVMKTIDTGRARKFGDVLAMQGFENTLALAASVKWWFWYDYYRDSHRSPGSIHISHTRLMEEMEAHPERELQRRLKECVRSSAYRLLAPSVLSFIYSGACLLDEDAAADWLEKVGSGVKLGGSSPAYQFRQRLLDNRLAKGKLPYVELAALGIRSWNGFVQRKKYHNLRWRGRGNAAEPFPTFYGLDLMER